MPQQVGDCLYGKLALAFLEAGLFSQQQSFDEIGYAAIAGARLRLHELGNLGPEPHGEGVAHGRPPGKEARYIRSILTCQHLYGAKRCGTWLGLLLLFGGLLHASGILSAPRPHALLLSGL
jgi:hypothetical protein